ncbi:MAG: hypothetical protein IJG94_03185 [Clostridia bacterium]|jgi:hypothetical protein|nr:hypothetical protein [Clostridia bacterium]
MVRRILAVLAGLAVLLVAAFGAADLAWQADTPGQQALRAYMDRVNVFLQEMGEQPVNSLFEMYKQLATFGITAREGADEPEGVEISVSLLYDAINSLVLRVNDPGRFPVIAAALIQALNPDTISRESALSVPQERARKAAKNPQNSFEDPVEELNGTQPRMYYAYYPNQYRDGVNWLQMTIIFPLEGTWDGSSTTTAAETTKAPDTWSGNDANYDGYFSSDDYTHYEIFTTATPEPDSAAAEEWEMGWE